MGGTNKTDRRQRGGMPSGTKPADLFRVLKAMAADPDIGDGEFRIAFRIAQAVNERTGWAEISDPTLMAEACASDQKVRRARRALEAAGWLHTVEGVRGRPTRYLFLDDRRPEIEKRVKTAAATRDANWQVEQIKRQAALSAEAMGITVDGDTGEITPAQLSAIPVKNDHVSPSPVSPLLPQSSTSQVSLSEKDETQDVHTREPEPAPCSECGRPSVGYGDFGDAYCEEHMWIARTFDPP